MANVIKYTRNCMVKKPRIESEQLSRIFMKWVSSRGVEAHPWTHDINRIGMRHGLGKDFDEYVWACGGRIGREHGKRYAEFFEDADLTLFALKHL